MKTQHLTVLVALCMTALASCSDSEPVAPPDINTDMKEIRFAAVAGSDSRSSDITTLNLSAFNVYAYLDSTNTMFMDNVTVTKGAGNQWVYSPVEYWPTQPLNFYAYAPSTWVPSAGIRSKFKFSNSGMEDVIYAVSLDRTQPVSMSDAQVRLNFRHALAKVSVFLASANKDITVKVTTVSLVGVSQEASFAFPTASTDVTGTTVDPNSLGTWSDYSTPHAYVLHMTQTLDDILTLTDTLTDVNPDGYLPQYMLPQELKWTDGASHLTDDYLQINLSMYDTSTGVKIWPNDKTPATNLVPGSTNGDGLIKFPLSTSSISSWLPGCHYIYNVSIDGHKDLTAIEFGSPSVDSFVTVTTDYNFAGAE